MASERLGPFRLRLDAPVTLAFAGLALLATLTPGANALLRLDPLSVTALLNPRWYLGLVGHVFAHQNLVHLAGNLAMLLLLGPGLERQLGSRRFLVILAALIVVTGASASLLLAFTQRSLVGASGLVFALIMIHSLHGTRQREIPVSALLLALLWGAQELVGLFDHTQIANSAHLNGALWGFLFGVYLLPRS